MFWAPEPALPCTRCSQRYMGDLFVSRKWADVVYPGFSISSVHQGRTSDGLATSGDAGRESGKLTQTSQDLTQRQCFGRQVPHRGRVIWSPPAQHVVNFVRACDFYPFLSPWGHPQTQRGNLEIQIVKARRTRVHANAPAGTVGYLNVGGPVVACADEWIYVDKVKVQDRFLDTTEVLRISDRLEDGGWN